MPQSSTKRKIPRWHLNYHDASTSSISQPSRTAAARSAIEAHFNPPGFPEGMSATNPVPVQEAANPKRVERKRDALRAKYSASWNSAFSPIRTLITSAFALFMTPSSVQAFSVGSVVTVLFMHLRALFAIPSVFRTHSSLGASLIPQVIVHFILCIVGVGMGLAKAQVLGFLPTTQSDWVALLPLRTVSPSSVYHPMVFPS